MYKFSYLQNVSPEYIEDLFRRYSQNPESVHPTWKYFFDGLELGEKEVIQNGESLPSHSPTNGDLSFSSEAKVAELITAFRELGIEIAQINPLEPPKPSHPLLELSKFGLKSSDQKTTFTAGKLLGLGATTLGNIIEHLKKTYCGSIGVEFTHMKVEEEREWLQNIMETSQNKEALSVENRKFILRRLIETETFERFLHTRFVAQKRFSIEGGDTLIPALDRMIEVGSELGATQFVMGMAHRGRLNVLANIYGKKTDYIFTEFEQNYTQDGSMGEGDVKYHMGFSADIKTRQGNDVHLSLASNPSHLEFVNPVVEGVARGKQRYLKDKSRSKVIPVLIHGDGAFAGQGVVYETLNLSQLPGYRTGGTIHIVINNQIGFTTTPSEARSTSYSTDLAKMLDVPIFHVNGDDPEAVWYVSRICTEFRQKFKKDVFIDLICYRKYGHNEGDEPGFTQPLMYKKIKTHPSPRELYEKKLISENVISTDEGKKQIESLTEKLNESLIRTRKENPRPLVQSYTNRWKEFHHGSLEELLQKVDTSVPRENIELLADKLYIPPKSFNLHPKLRKLYGSRLEAVKKGEGLDWGNAETLAYASLLSEGHTVRISGQDVERGTFSHRHAVLHDHENDTEWVPLTHFETENTRFIIKNSHLSETGVLGFEYGWSLADPSALVIWEAQFGDFANGAQVIIDQFIASGESKWQRASGLVMNLPHGYEGMGPEHSSARLERFLQLSAKQNMTVANLSTPAQVFHILRRQLKRKFRKPLVIMTPKSLLRHPKAVSTVEDLSSGQFLEVVDDPHTKQRESKVTRIVICSGKIYYELLEAQLKEKVEDVAVLRLEQIHPWPKGELAKTISQYPETSEIVWVQEEPVNMGAWSFVYNIWTGSFDNFKNEVNQRMISYIGRDSAAAPAVGSGKLHAKEQREIIKKALRLK